MKENKAFSKIWLLVVLLVTFVSGCGGSGSDSNVDPSAKAITAYSFAGGTGTIDETAKTIAVTLPSGTDVTVLVANFTTTGAGVKVAAVAQTSDATANNFTTPVAYTVTAADGSTATYTVTVTVASITAKSITSYSLAGVAGTINETAKTITVTMPAGTVLAGLAATFTTTGTSVKVGTTVQLSGVTANDFTNSVAYKVSAADNSTVTYAVTVTVASVSAKAITAYSIAGFTGSAGTINETATPKTIAVTVPNGTNITALVAAFTTTGTGIKVAAAAQKSGITANNFTTPVAYTVTAVDGTTATYNVTVTVAANSAKAVTAYSLAGVAGAVNETAKSIAVTLPSGTSLAAQVATFTTTGTGVKVGTVVQTSTITANNFTTPVAYIVTAADGTTATYTVTVTMSAAKGPAPVLLGAAGNYVILATSEVSTVPASVITGDVGLSPAATSFLHGFSLTMVGTVSATSTQVTGSLYGADMSPPTSTRHRSITASRRTKRRFAAFWKQRSAIAKWKTSWCKRVMPS